MRRSLFTRAVAFLMVPCHLLSAQDPGLRTESPRDTPLHFLVLSTQPSGLFVSQALSGSGVSTRYEPTSFQPALDQAIQREASTRRNFLGGVASGIAVAGLSSLFGHRLFGQTPSPSSAAPVSEIEGVTRLVEQGVQEYSRRMR